jgi:hypothetical protein
MKYFLLIGLFPLSIFVSGCMSLFSLVDHAYSFDKRLPELCLSKLKDGKGTLSFFAFDDAKEFDTDLTSEPFSLDGFVGAVSYGTFRYDDKTKDDYYEFLVGNHKNRKFLIREYRWKDGELVFSCEHFFDR